MEQRCPKNATKCTQKQQNVQNPKNCIEGSKLGNKVDKLLLPCKIQGNEECLIALIDTGSQATLIHKKHVRKSEIRPSNTAMVAANDTVIPVVGTTNIQLIIGRLALPTKAYVTDALFDDLLIGMKFLWENGGDIKCSKKKFSIGPKKFRETFEITSDKNIGTLRASAQAIRVKEDTFLKPGEGIKVETHNEQIRENEDFFKKHSLNCEIVDYGKRVKLYVFNNTKNNKMIRKGQTLATIRSRDLEIRKIIKCCKLLCDKENRKSLPVLIRTQQVKLEKLSDSKGNAIKIIEHPNEPEELNKRAILGIKKRLKIFSPEMKLANTPPGSIEVKDDTPIKRRNYKLGVIERQELRKIIKEMEKAGLVRRETSPYESPCFLKRKPNKDWRLLVDYRQMNEKIVKNNDRVPRVEEIWAALRNMRYFTTLDLNQGFFQIPLEEESKKYTGINVGGIGYVFNCIPQGMSASPCIFQKVMTDIFHDMLFEKCIVYLDDICVFGKTLAETIKHTEEVLDRLAKHNLKVKASKCKFYGTEIELLGQKISYNRMEPQKKNITPIKNAQPPKTVKALQSFIGAANYHRSYIKNFARIMAPLTDLLKTDNQVVRQKGSAKLKKWGEEEQRAFDAIKDALTSEPIRTLYDPDAETLLEVDASKTALGAVLLQIDPTTKRKHPVAYFSQKVPMNKRHLAPFDQEMNAITNSCEFFREYLLGKEFTIFTDHQPLTFQANFKKPSPRLARLVSKLGEFTFRIKHIKGENNHMADYLSRKDEEGDEIEFKEGEFVIKKDVNAVTRGALKKTENQEEKGRKEIFERREIKNQLQNKKFLAQKEKIQEIAPEEKLRTEQRADPYWQNMISFLEKGEIKNAKRHEKIQIARSASEFFIDKETGILFKKAQKTDFYNAVPVIPDSMISHTLQMLHENMSSGGHFGYKKTLEKAKQRVYFTKMSSKIKNHVLSCHECQIHKDKAAKLGNLKPMPIRNFKPMQHIEIDFVGKMKTISEKKYIIVGIDKSTKYCFTKAVREPNANNVIKFLKELIFHQGRPDKITCDNGSHFLNNKVHDFCNQKGIKIFHSTSYAPQTQGQVERMNGIIKKYLVKYQSCESEEWDDHVRDAAMVYNQTPIQGLNNRTPFYLMHGYEATPPTNLEIPEPKIEKGREQQIEDANKARNEIPRLDQRNAEKYSKQYNKGRKIENFDTNDLVLLKNEKFGKGIQKFLGPFRIVKKVNDLNYIIRIVLENGDTKDDTVHIRRLMRYNPRKNKTLPALIETEQENTSDEDEPPIPIKRKRGRPKKVKNNEQEEEQPKRKRGRPPKIIQNNTVTKIQQTPEGIYIKHQKSYPRPNPMTEDSDYYTEWEFIPYGDGERTFWRRGAGEDEWERVRPKKGKVPLNHSYERRVKSENQPPTPFV